MSEKEEIKRYLQEEVNPLLKPLLEQLSKTRPPNIMEFILQYAQHSLQQQKEGGKVGEGAKGQGKQVREVQGKQAVREGTLGSQQQGMTREQEEAFARKLQQKNQRRGKKTSRKGISAQVFGDYNQKSAFSAPVHAKSKDTGELLRGLLRKSIMFGGLSEENMGVVVGAMEEVRCAVGKEVIREGEAGDVLYVVVSGEYECSKVIGGKPTYLKSYHSGELFGELSLMYNAKRAASVKCSKAGTLFALDRLTFINIVQESAIRKRAEHEKIISRIEILSEVQANEKHQLCDALREETFQAGNYVVREGEDGDRLYFVIEGNLVAEKDNAKTGRKDIVFKYKEKEYFGEIALMKNTVRQASIRAVTKCKLLSIGRQEFKRLLGPIDNILQRNMDKYKKFLNKA